MHGTFNDQAGDEYYMETSNMEKLRLKHEDHITSTIKEIIARMIVNRKCVLIKLSVAIFNTVKETMKRSKARTRNRKN